MVSQSINDGRTSVAVTFEALDLKQWFLQLFCFVCLITVSPAQAQEFCI
jgi:hypothetical protein